MTFVEFFRAATASAKDPLGRMPYPYQEAFAECADLPDFLEVPTGVGKTATAILGWLYRRRMAAEEIRKSTPRRLIYCLPMRTLVEQTFNSAKIWLQQLKFENVGLHVLMGGVDDSSWDEHPEKDAILIGTQDMLLSRALNRGYGMSRYRWPVHFALLNNDCLWVIDETQLLGVGLTTTAQMQGLREKLGTYGVTASVWMSATLDPVPLRTVDHSESVDGFVRHTLTERDLIHEPITRRLNAKKALERSAVLLSSESERKNYAKDLAQEVKAAHRLGTLTLVVVNRVARAQAIYGELKKLGRAKSEPLTADLAIVHARLRPSDRKRHENSLFSETIPAAGRIVVATQAIEAGVDVSAATLFTELAPWSSFVQRVGRCNRAGEFDTSRVVWIDLAIKDEKDKVVFPYAADDLNRSRLLLASLVDVGPAALQLVHDDCPAQVVHTLRRKDLLDLWDTTPDLAGNDLDVSRFIRDAEDTDLQFFWRSWEGELPPESFPAAGRDELCSVAVGAARDFLKKIKADKQSALVWRPLEREHRWRPLDLDEVRPGLVLLLPVGAGGYSDELGWTGDKTDLPSPVTLPPTNTDQEEGLDDGRNIQSSHWVSLTEHLDDVTRAAADLQRGLAHLSGNIPWKAVELAARWHDVGKSHPAFQNMLLRSMDASSENLPDRLWAKSGNRSLGRPRYFMDRECREERIGFRHELASALAWLAHHGDHLDASCIAFLIAAHHGKVRGQIRSLPNEPKPDNPTVKFARGVYDGDQLPAVNLGNGETMPATTLDLSLMELGESTIGPSWLSRVIELRDRAEYGPFRLSLLETLVRVADWRGSLAGEHNNAK